MSGAVDLHGKVDAYPVLATGEIEGFRAGQERHRHAAARSAAICVTRARLVSSPVASRSKTQKRSLEKARRSSPRTS